MPKVDLEAGKEAYKEAVRIVPDRYSRKVDKADWKTPAESDAAEKAWKDALEKAMREERRKKGIAKVSNEEWKKAAKEVGSKRIKEGMEGKETKWADHFKPFAEAIESAKLPERTADWKENLKRVEAIVEALVKKKEELMK
jgi:hypothetical protein